MTLWSHLLDAVQRALDCIALVLVRVRQLRLHVERQRGELAAECGELARHEARQRRQGVLPLLLDALPHRLHLPNKLSGQHSTFLSASTGTLRKVIEEVAHANPGRVMRSAAQQSFCHVPPHTCPGIPRLPPQRSS